MNIERFLLNILKKIESLKPGVIAYSTKIGNDSGISTWYEISISDFDLYMNDKRLKVLIKAWHIAAKARGEKIIFVCGWVPTEEKLVNLMKKNNLILNI